MAAFIFRCIKNTERIFHTDIDNIIQLNEYNQGWSN